jgi:hypothetical protein
MHATEESVQRVNRLHKQYPWFPADYSFESNPLARPLLSLATGNPIAVIITVINAVKVNIEGGVIERGAY